MKMPGQQNNSDSSKLFEELFQGLVKERSERGDGETVKGSEERHSFERQKPCFVVFSRQSTAYLLIRFEAKRAANVSVILPASQQPLCAR